MKSINLVLAAIIALGFVPSACAQQRLVVDTGHIGPVNTLAYDRQDSLLFSGGSDGTVRAWDVQSHQLVGTFQTGHLPVEMLAVNPARHEIATFETDNLNTFRITAWNWETDKRLFTKNLSEAPLFMQFSPGGSYLVYGVTAWRSLYFLDSRTGRTLPYFRNGIGIVSAVIVSSSQHSIMTYSPSGQIQYWALDSGDLKQSYQTVANMSAISFTSNNRYMFGSHDGNLVMVDLVGGQTVASVPLSGIENTSVDPSTNELAVYTDGSGGPQFALFTYSGGLQQMASAFDSPPASVSDIVYADGVLVASQQQAGTLLYQRPYFSQHTFGENNLLHIDDIAVDNHTLLLTSKDRILSFGSRFFGLSHLSLAHSVSFSTVPNPYKGPTGVVALGGGRFVLWNTGGQSGSYRIYDPNSGMGPAIGGFSAPFSEIQQAGGNLLTLDSQGTINLLDPNTGTSSFSYTAFGLQTVAYAGPQQIIAGLSQTGSLNTSLLQLNPANGETVPIPDSSLLVFGLAYDPTNQVLYSLDMENAANGGTTTALKSHQLQTLGGGTTLLSYSGEDQNAGIAIDPQSFNIFTSLGFDGVREISSDGSTTTRFEATNHIPRKLLINGEWVISLNTDSTVTVWDRVTGKRLFDLYLFKNLSWAAILSSGQYLASPGAEKYIKVFNGTQPSTNNLGNYQYPF